MLEAFLLLLLLCVCVCVCVMAITISMLPESGRILYVGSDFLHLIRFRSAKEGSTMRFWPDTSDLEVIQCAKNQWDRLWQNAPGPLPVSNFQTRLRSSTDGPDHIVQNQPGSDLILADCVRLWPNGSGPADCVRLWPNGSGLADCVRLWPNGSGLADCVTLWPNGSGLADCVTLWPNGSGLADCVTLWPNGSGPADFVTLWPNGSGPADCVRLWPNGSGLADCVRLWPNGSGPEAGQCARIIRPASGQRFRADPVRVRIGSGMFTGVPQLFKRKESRRTEWNQRLFAYLPQPNA